MSKGKWLTIKELYNFAVINGKENSFINIGIIDNYHDTEEEYLVQIKDISFVNKYMTIGVNINE